MKHLTVIVILVASAVAACGGQPKHAEQQNERLGNQAGDVPKATLQQRDFEKAAQGHGAAGVIPPEELARLEAESAPGGTLGKDAGK